MLWVLGVAWVFTNLPCLYLLYNYTKQKKLNNFFYLWKLAPNQFIFMFLFLPFAIYFTILTVYMFVTKIKPLLPLDYSPVIKNFFYDNWAIVSMVAIIVAAFITIVVYYCSGFSIDKLQLDYINRAVDAMTNAKPISEEIDLPTNLSVEQFEELTDNQYILVVSSRKYQMNFNLLNPVVQALNVLQMFVAIFFAVVLVICTFLACHLINFNVDCAATHMERIINLITASAICFAFFPICYNLYRKRVYDLTHVDTTIAQDILAIIAIFVVIFVIRLVLPANRSNFQNIVKNTLPAIFAVSGYGIVNVKFMDTLERLVGIKSSVGTQIILFIILFIIGIFAIALIGTSDR